VTKEEALMMLRQIFGEDPTELTSQMIQDAVQKHPEVFEALILDYLQKGGANGSNGDDPRQHSE
jgi:hypothetical protein